MGAPIKKLASILLAFLLARPSWSAAAYVASNSTNTGLTTTGINTTGASLLTACVSDYQRNATTDAVTDSNGNTWHHYLNYGGGGNNSNCAIWYAYDKSGGALVVGSGHTATLGSSAGFPYFAFMAFSGTQTGSDPGTAQNGNAINGSATVQTGSVTPNASGDIFYTCFCPQSGVPQGIDSSFTAKDMISTGGDMHGGHAYKVATAAAENPIWTNGTSVAISATIATFKQAASAVPAGGSKTKKLLKMRAMDL